MVLVGRKLERTVARGEQQAEQEKGEEGQSSVTDNNHNSNPKKILEVKDKCVKVRVTMDSGAAGHVMPEAMFPRVKLERKMPPKWFVAAKGEQIKDLGEKKSRSRQTKESRSASHSEVQMLSNPSFRGKRSCELETLLCWMKRIRTSETFGMEQ